MASKKIDTATLVKFTRDKALPHWFMSEYADLERQLRDGGVHKPLVTGNWPYALMFLAVFPAILVKGSLAIPLSISVIIAAWLFASYVVYKRSRYEKFTRESQNCCESLEAIAMWAKIGPNHFHLVPWDRFTAHLDEMMIQLCLKVLDFQEANKELNPRDWKPEEQEMVNEIKRRYGVLEPFGFMPPNGYGFYFAEAKRVLQASNA
ncbi:MAG: hypothetical protein ABIT47_01550 [Candidatus Paceibacterota bacterium]